jgi:hypothetical protein
MFKKALALWAGPYIGCAKAWHSHYTCLVSPKHLYILRNYLKTWLILNRNFVILATDIAPNGRAPYTSETIINIMKVDGAFNDRGNTTQTSMTDQQNKKYYYLIYKSIRGEP